MFATQRTKENPAEWSSGKPTSPSLESANRTPVEQSAGGEVDCGWRCHRRRVGIFPVLASILHPPRLDVGLSQRASFSLRDQYTTGVNRSRSPRFRSRSFSEADERDSKRLQLLDERTEMAEVRPRTVTIAPAPAPMSATDMPARSSSTPINLERRTRPALSRLMRGPFVPVTARPSPWRARWLRAFQRRRAGISSCGGGYGLVAGNVATRCSNSSGWFARSCASPFWTRPCRTSLASDSSRLNEPSLRVSAIS